MLLTYVLAFIVPGLAVILRGKIWQGIALLILQATVLGWIPAVVIALLLIHE